MLPFSRKQSLGGRNIKVGISYYSWRVNQVPRLESEIDWCMGDPAGRLYDGRTMNVSRQARILFWSW
jgi:hypothetical protein